MTDSLDWLSIPCPAPSEAAAQAARQRQDQLTKPRGALGQLESLAIQLAALQDNPKPSVDPVQICLFAGDHGVVAEGVSAYPQSVTVSMVRNIAGGGAAISVLARTLGAALEVIDCGTLGDLTGVPGVRCEGVGPGTANLVQGPAMTHEQVTAALAIGRRAAERAAAAGVRLLIGGEMGIGNTTPAAALACALLGLPAELLVGPGTGLDKAGIRHKAAVVDCALALHAAPDSAPPVSPLAILERLGGFEIAAMAGCYLACGQQRIPVLVDGFISTAAALCACRINPSLREWLLFSHGSAEPGHRALLAGLDARPLVDLGMRLGEGSGAAVALPLVRLACTLHNGMATFAEAGVAG
ncbi:nicotinate-nucleotide--dimethylbenzimidazole phosphoribosyltransferase [uncultured Thiodictyon sp.]|uniref:nicotinate-nucleotide--dimethylbenzimidazole phosphoribosyltransferase n=1 Tax=uncultured Thiodictyon sp. TaxID=1846217 RepID=UPI0025E6FE7D|nr:nicotinate-nucleotide--dimethylbenzimidazole phosphoribosyltransferase [uncultured Thiodictyon sp.]